MNRERLEQIGKFLEGRMVVHRNVEHDSPWTTEEKMIQELYENYLDLLIEYGKQKEVIDKAITNINILIEIIKQQPTDNALDDLWILDKLNGFKNILKEVE